MELYTGKDYIINFATNSIKALDVLEDVEKYFKKDNPYDTIYTHIKKTIEWGISELRGECCVGEEEFFKLADYIRIISGRTLPLVPYDGDSSTDDRDDDNFRRTALVNAYRVRTLANGALVIIKVKTEYNEYVIVFYRRQNDSPFVYSSSGSISINFVYHVVDLFDKLEDLSIP